MEHERYGNFKISKKLIEMQPEAVRGVMAKCIITRAEFVLSSDCIEYTAISELFKPVRWGEQIPNYDITVNEKKEVFAKLL